MKTNKKIKPFDNRMSLFSYLEGLNKPLSRDDKLGFAEEYEYFSDSRICGKFYFGQKRQVIFRMIDGEKNKDGYYRYVLRLPIVFTDSASYFDLKKVAEAREDGYYFKDGLAHEFICIFALFLRARFYLESRIFRNIEEITSKITYPVFLPDTVREYNPIFNDQKKNLTEDLIPFFKKITNLPDKGHFNIIHAFREYHEALKNIGIDHDIAYLKLVVSAEGIASIEKTKSSFEKDFPDCFALIKYNKDCIKQIENLWRNRKAQNSLLLFFNEYLLKNHPEFEKTVYSIEGGGTQEILLKNTLERIYGARSGYVHEGRPMIISRDTFEGSAYTASLGGTIDRKKILVEEILPVISYFENMVHLALVNFVMQNAVK